MQSPGNFAVTSTFWFQNLNSPSLSPHASTLWIWWNSHKRFVRYCAKKLHHARTDRPKTREGIKNMPRNNDERQCLYDLWNKNMLIGNIKQQPMLVYRNQRCSRTLSTTEAGYKTCWRHRVACRQRVLCNRCWRSAAAELCSCEPVSRWPSVDRPRLMMTMTNSSLSRLLLLRLLLQPHVISIIITIIWNTRKVT